MKLTKIANYLLGAIVGIYLGHITYVHFNPAINPKVGECISLKSYPTVVRKIESIEDGYYITIAYVSPSVGWFKSMYKEADIVEEEALPYMQIVRCP